MTVPALGQELPPVGPAGVLAPHDPGVVMVIVEPAGQDDPAPPGRVVVITLVLVTVAPLHPAVTPPTFVVPVPEPPPVSEVVPYQSVQADESCRGSTGLAAAKMLECQYSSEP